MIEPVGDRVLVKRDDDKTITSGGITIPSAYTEKSEFGTVLAAGPGKQTDEGEFIVANISVGDRVMFQKNYGIEITVNKENCVMLKSYDILATIEDEDE